MAFTEIDEKLLVRAYQAGDERAFDTIVRTQYNALYAHALRRLSSHEAAEDAVQDTLLRAYRALGNLDGDLALRAWLHRILTNVCYDEGNRRRRQQGLVDKVGALPEEVAGDPADEAALYDTVRIMSEALADLPESYREALVLRYVDGLSFREVAEVAGVTEENARARVHRGRQALHKIMSRVAILVAFVVPGLRKTQHAATTGGEQAVSVGAPDHAFVLTTQLTSHVVNAAPALSRFAEMSSAMPGGKSAFAAAALTAVAAVSVPVAYTVNEVRKPERVPAASAEPAPVVSPEAPGPSAAGVPAGEGAGAVRPTAVAPVATTTVPSTTTTSTLPPSAARPFEPVPGVVPSTTVPARTSPSTSTSTTTSTTVAPAPAEKPTGPVGDVAATVTVEGELPQVDIDGPVTVMVDGKQRSGGLTGRIYLYDDGTMSADDLSLALDDGTLDLRLRGTYVRTESAEGVSDQVEARYALRGADRIGLADGGVASGTFDRNGPAGTLRLELRGRRS